MTLTLDFSGDFTVWDGVEPIRFESTQRASPILDVVASAKRRALTARELAASGGVYTGQDLVWLLPVRLLTQAVPKPADVVVDSASQTRWTVLSTQLGKWQQTWKLTCRDLILANALWDTVSIERAALSYDAAGAAVKTWPPAAGQVLYQSLPARVQLLTDAVVDQRGLRGFVGNYAVIVDRQVSVTSEDRIKWSDRGTVRTLDIRGLHNPSRIDELPVLDAELRP